VVHTDFEYSEFALAFVGRVPEAADRVKQALAPLGLIALVEGPQFLSNATTVHVLIAGPDEGSAFAVDITGQVGTIALSQVLDERIIAQLSPAAAFVNDVCIYGAPLPPADTDDTYQTWAIFAGPGLKAEHMVAAASKDKGASWSFWEASGCGFARYTGDRRYYRFSFPDEAGTVIGLIPEFQDIHVVVFARGQRKDFEFSRGLVRLADFPAGSEAAAQLQLLWNDWFDLVDQTFTQLAEATLNPRAAAELQRALEQDAGFSGLLDLLRNLGISRSAVDYAFSGDQPAGARSYKPRGTLDRVRIIREEIAARTGQKPSFGAGLSILKGSA